MTEEMRAEYDLRGGVRGKYYEKYYDGLHYDITTSNASCFTFRFSEKPPDHSGLPPGSQVRWKRGIWG